MRRSFFNALFSDWRKFVKLCLFPFVPPQALQKRGKCWGQNLLRLCMVFSHIEVTYECGLHTCFLCIQERSFHWRKRPKTIQNVIFVLCWRTPFVFAMWYCTVLVLNVGIGLQRCLQQVRGGRRERMSPLWYCPSVFVTFIRFCQQCFRH